MQRRATEEQIGNLDWIKFKNCASNDTINSVKRQPTQWEKIFSSHMSDKELVSRIYKEFIIIKKQQWIKDLNRYFSSYIHH